MTASVLQLINKLEESSTSNIIDMPNLAVGEMLEMDSE